MKGSLNTLRVFISYSWSSPQHELWVAEFAQRLIGDGVHVVLDKWDLKEGQDKHKFMEKMVNDTQISKVLVICDNAYQTKANDRKGGVGTESQLISKEIYENTEQEKFIPIIREYKDGKACLPSFMGSRIYIDFSNEDIYEAEYEKLIRNLYGKPQLSRPPLGAPPYYILDENEEPSESIQQFQRIKYELTSQKTASSAGSTSVFLESLIKDLEKHRLNGGNTADFDEKVLNSIEEMKKFRDVFVDFTIKVIRKTGTIDKASYKDFFEKILILLEPLQNMQQYTRDDFDNFKFFIYELFIYFSAILIKERQYQLASHFINGNYFFSKRFSNELLYNNISAFNESPSSIEERRNTRLNLHRVSIVADLIKERAQREDINFELIKEIDVVLYIITSLNAKDRNIWFPRTSVYRSSAGDNNVLLFQKMISREHFENVKVLFNVTTKDQLFSRVGEYKVKLESGKIRTSNNWDYSVPRIEKAINIENIATIE